jgi:hypothetical protein
MTRGPYREPAAVAADVVAERDEDIGPVVVGFAGEGTAPSWSSDVPPVIRVAAGLAGLAVLLLIGMVALGGR